MESGGVMGGLPLGLLLRQEFRCYWSTYDGIVGVWYSTEAIALHLLTFGVNIREEVHGSSTLVYSLFSGSAYVKLCVRLYLLEQRKLISGDML